MGLCLSKAEKRVILVSFYPCKEMFQSVDVVSSLGILVGDKEAPLMTGSDEGCTRTQTATRKRPVSHDPQLGQVSYEAPFPHPHMPFNRHAGNLPLTHGLLLVIILCFFLCSFGS